MARATPLTAADMGDLGDECAGCTFWELGGPRPYERTPTTDPATEALRKQAWVTTQELESGAPGRVVRVDGRIVGWTVFAPAPAFPARAFATSPALSPGALVLATIRVDPQHRGHGVGRLLLQAAVKEAVHRELAWVEVTGSRVWREDGCVLPVSWLLHEGFQVHTPHPTHPVLRLSTSRTVRWTEAIGHAVDEVMDLLPRMPSRSPSTAPDAFDQQGRR